MSDNVFKDLKAFVQGSPIAAWLFVVSFALLLFGIVTFAEDTYSSYVGIQMIEKTYAVKPASWPVSYWMLSLFFQIVTIISFFVFLSNKRKYFMAFLLTLVAQSVDFLFDVWYRSNGRVFSDPKTFIISSLLTIVFYTFGSEGAITFGFGFTQVLFVDGLRELGKFIYSIFAGLGAVWGELFPDKPGKPSGSLPNFPPPQQKPQGQNGGNAQPPPFHPQGKPNFGPPQQQGKKH